MLQSSYMLDELLHTILLSLWFFLPAGIGNVTPIFAARLPILKNFNAPLDAGLSIDGARLLGSHKTWRGLITGTLMATLAFWLEQQAVAHSAFFQSVASDTWTPTLLPLWLLGPLLGLGALLGDAIESFFKRRSHIAPGHSWFPYDQIDFILGAMVLSSLVIMPSIGVYAVGIVLWTVIQLIAQYIGYWLGLKERPI